MSEPLDFMRLDGERISVVWMQRGALLDCIYLGPRLTRGEDLQALALAIRHGRHENQPDAPPVGGLLPDPGTGWRGPTLVRLSLGSHSIQPNWTLSVFEQTDNCLLAGWEDGQFELQVRWQMTPGDIVAASTKVIANDGGEIGVDRLASLLLPLPRGFDHVTHFAGRWADDMRAERLPITRAGLCWASTGGKSAFAGGD